MLQFNSARLIFLTVHKAGNKTLEEDLEISKNLLPVSDDNLLNILQRYFLSSFSDNEVYSFCNDVGLEQNEMFVLAGNIFANPGDFLNQSQIMAQHLYNATTHPKAKGGELFVSYYKNVLIDDEVTDMIGLFKSEKKEDYLKVEINKALTKLDYEEGMNTNKPDKGCLIFNTNKEKGFAVCIVDNSGKTEEAQYWKNTFLQLKPVANEFHQTNQFLGIAKNFVTKQLDEEFPVTKADQIDLLNRSVAYFKTHERFEKKEFEEEVFQDTGLIKSFQNFDSRYRQENQVELTDYFDISPQAVKKQARIFKSVLKLDKNFHIYIHGNRDLIEQGIDTDGRKYYKIYYEKES